VFTGSSTGEHPAYRAAASAMGASLVSRDIELVFGGGQVGLMGVIADEVLARGGKAIGIIPEALAVKEVAHERLTTLEVVDTMHTRKARMAELSDAFVAMPGGFGTLEELFEVLTWAQLGLHQKPIGLLNVAGYYDALLAFIDHSITAGFVRAEYKRLFVVDHDPRALLDALRTHHPPPIPRWITSDET
jgi:uncharacterized protein (TIGR00730 family)